MNKGEFLPKFLKNSKDVYVDKETGMVVKKLQTGAGRFLGMSLWQPMKKGLFSYVPDRSKESFWYDTCDYVKLGGEQNEQNSFEDRRRSCIYS